MIKKDGKTERVVFKMGGSKGWPRGAGLDCRVAVSFILPVSQLTENIVYQTHITRFSAVSRAEILEAGICNRPNTFNTVL